MPEACAVPEDASFLFFEAFVGVLRGAAAAPKGVLPLPEGMVAWFFLGRPRPRFDVSMLGKGAVEGP